MRRRHGLGEWIGRRIYERRRLNRRLMNLCRGFQEVCRFLNGKDGK